MVDLKEQMFKNLVFPLYFYNSCNLELILLRQTYQSCSNKINSDMFYLMSVCPHHLLNMVVYIHTRASMSVPPPVYNSHVKAKS